MLTNRRTTSWQEIYPYMYLLHRKYINFMFYTLVSNSEELSLKLKVHKNNQKLCAADDGSQVDGGLIKDWIDMW